MATANHHSSVCMAVFFLSAILSTAQAETLLWYRFDGDGATIVNKANPGTMDGTLKSINTWGALAGLGDTSSKFPTRGDAFPSGTRIIDPASGSVQSDTVKSLSFSGDPANSGTVRLLKADATAALKEMMSCTCEVFFKLPSDSEAIETRRAKDILFPLVNFGSPDGNGLGWFFGLRKDNSSTGFYPFFRSKHHNGTSVPQKDCQDKTYLNDDKWHHLAVVITADTSANKAVVRFVLDYTMLGASTTLDDFYGFHNKNTGNFPFLVGADLWRKYNSVQNCCFMGEIAEVRVSNTALSADQLLRPLPEGPVDDDTLLYLPMGDSGWFGSQSTASYTNKHHGILAATTNTAWAPYWIHGTTSATYPAISSVTSANSIRSGYLSLESFADTNSVAFSRALVNSKYAGHVMHIPYEGKGLTENSFTMEWFFKTDGQVPSGDGINSYTFLYNSFAKIMINQSNGKLLTRLVPAEGNYEDFNSTGRVDDAEWHHYALVYDKSQGAFAAYLDYRMINSKTYELTTLTSREFIFGGETASSQAFSGQIDDLRITKRALKASEFLTTRQFMSEDLMFARFEGDLSTGQDSVISPDGVGGTLGGGSAPTYVDVNRRIDLDGDGKEDYVSTKALRLDGGSVVYPHNSLLECRDFTVEWFAKYESLTNNIMLLRFGMASETGEGTVSWALYKTVGTLRIGAFVSADGFWHDLKREDKNFVDTGSDAVVADGRWHHWALVAETHPNETPANTTFTLYKDYEQVGNALVFDKEGKGGILALPSTATTLSIGTGGGCLTGYIDELRFRPGVQPVSSFMRRLSNGLIVTIK